MRTHKQLFIGGDWVAPSTDAMLDVISPHTEEVFARVAEAREADVDRAVAAARAAFDDGPWPRLRAAERADAMARLLAALQERSEEMATRITDEMGSPIAFSNLGQVMASNMVLDYYIRLAREFAFEDVRDGMLGPTIVRREPVGVVAAIVPWNVPLFTIMLKLAPALAAGCTIVIKPAPETPLDAYILAEACIAAGIPAAASWLTGELPDRRPRAWSGRAAARREGGCHGCSGEAGPAADSGVSRAPGRCALA